MRAAIYAEGRSDLAVVSNILKGYLDIDQSEILLQLPELDLDETDLHSQEASEFSNWTLVKKECITREKLAVFLETYETAFVCIQIDTAERFEKEYDVTSPPKADNKNESYSSDLRTAIIEKVNCWLENEFAERIAYAICIEETDAWILALHEEKDSSIVNHPKEALQKLIRRKFSDKEAKQLRNKKAFAKYSELSKRFRKLSTLIEAMKWNKSLEEFCNSLDKFKQASESTEVYI